jgi:hypothetical protein
MPDRKATKTFAALEPVPLTCIGIRGGSIQIKSILLSFSLCRMIFFGKPVPTLPDHAPAFPEEAFSSANRTRVAGKCCKPSTIARGQDDEGSASPPPGEVS